ncbi:YceI family protein [Flavobacterium sp.]|uniref:YceI family protein n=1 Tax=Flavobacterium sp. TaxID=239 RepID=UPI0038FBF9CA
MTAANWDIDSRQSDVILRARHSIIAYLASSINKFKGSINVKNDELEDASVEFEIDVNHKIGKLEKMETNFKLKDLFDTTQNPIISFKSTSFEKVNANINFIKGYLSINNVTKIVEFDAVLIDLETYNGTSKATFEVVGKINRKDFGLSYNLFSESNGIMIGQEITINANLEFLSKIN